MNINPIHESIGNIIKKNLFQVPRYQRGYAWRDEEIDDFLNDINSCMSYRLEEDSKKEHFLGGLVCVEHMIPGSSEKSHDLVDGQQRIATTIILVKCIVDAYKLIKEELEDDEKKKLVQAIIEDLSRNYLFKNLKIHMKFDDRDKLCLSNVDKQFFKNLIHGLELEDKRDSHKLILRSFSKISNWITSKLGSLESSDEKINYLDTIEKVLLDDFTVIFIATQSSKDAYKLFQVLNDRGIGLTEGDLLRAKSLEYLESENPQIKEIQANVETVWDTILCDESKIVDENLRDFYTAKIGKKPSKGALLDDFIKNIFPELENNGGAVSLEESKDFLGKINKLKEAIDKLRLIKEGLYPYLDDDSILTWDKELLRILIKELKHDLVVPLLLSSSYLAIDKFKDIIQMSLKVFFRYKIICSKHATSLSNIYFEESKIIFSNPSEYNSQSLKTKLQDLLNKKAEDTFFRTQLFSELYYNKDRGNKYLRFFLIFSEYYFNSYINNENPLKINKEKVIDFSSVNIEHIYPRNLNTNQIQELESVKNNLGNLMCYSEIRNLIDRNKAFSDKKADYVGSSFNVANWVGTKTQWSITEYNELKNKLLELSLKIFKV